MERVDLDLPVFVMFVIMFSVLRCCFVDISVHIYT